MVQNLVVALLRTTGIFFTGYCGCCSYCWFLHTFPVGLLLGKESCPNRECLGGPTPAQHGPEQWLLQRHKSPAPLPQDWLCYADVTISWGIGLRLDLIEKHILIELLPLLSPAFLMPLQMFPECVRLINSLHKNPQFLLCFYRSWPKIEIKKLCIGTQLDNSNNKQNNALRKVSEEPIYIWKHSQPHLVIRECKLNSTHQIGKFLKSENQNVNEDESQWEISYIVGGKLVNTPIVKRSLLIINTIEDTHKLEVSKSGIYPREFSDMCVRIFTVALFIIVKTGNNLHICQEWINCSIFIMYSS